MSAATRYRLVRTIAAGGMAQVYEAVAVGEQGFERRVAIKRVLPEFSQDQSMRRMFFDEAKIASRLHHGNIVQVLDYGMVDGTEFLVMEYVDGLDARRVTRRALKRTRPLPETLALHIVTEVAHALAYAHGLTDESGRSLGIVHRDVSPQNVLISWDGHVKLADFGIATAVEKEEKTATGVVKGKLSYMPPEQAIGERVDASADVYALGASLHTILVGMPPAADPENMARRLAGEPVDLDPSISEDVADLIRMCMAPTPSDRPTAEAVAFRAGQLAARALDRDVRGELREWLSSERPTAQSRGALDDLVGLCLVVTEAADREFTVSREVKSDSAAAVDPLPTKMLRGGVDSSAPTVLSRPSGEDLDDSVPLTTRWSPRVLAWVGAAVLVSVAVPTAVISFAESEDASEPNLAAESAGEDATAPDASEPPTEDPAAAAARPMGVESAASEPAAREAEPEPGAVAPREPRRRRLVAMTSMMDPPASPAVTAPVPAIASNGFGWVRVGHAPGGGQERVFVDDQAVGYTPNLFRIPAGSRRIEVRSVATGESRARDIIIVRTDHSRGAPAVLRR